MKIFITLTLIFLTSNIFSQNYGIVFVPGISGSADATFAMGYDHIRLENDLRTIFGGTPVFSFPDAFNKTDGLDTRATKLRNALLELETTNPDREWFLFGHSMGGVTAAYYEKVLRQHGDPIIKGIVSTNSPFSGINTLAESPEVYKSKFNKYFTDVGTGVNGENPWLTSDIIDLVFAPISWAWDGAPLEFSLGVDVTKNFLEKIKEASETSSDIYFEETPSINSLQKNSAQITSLNSFSLGSNYRIIASEDYEFTILRAGGSHPAYINRGPIGGWQFGSIAECFMEGVTSVNGFNADFKAVPYHAIGIWYGLREFFDNRVTAYRRSEHRFKTFWDLSSHNWTGMKNSMIEARKAKERYIFSRSSIDRLDYETQNMANDLYVKTEEITIHYKYIDDNWLKTCGNDSPEPPPIDYYKFSELPSVLGRDICDSPVYIEWDEKKIVVHPPVAVATDGIVTVPNQTPKNPGNAFIKVANTDPNDGNNHASAVWVVRPWSGKETETMQEAKRWIGFMVRDN